jgi:hypothetical protein
MRQHVFYCPLRAVQQRDVHGVPRRVHPHIQQLVRHQQLHYPQLPTLRLPRRLHQVHRPLFRLQLHRRIVLTDVRGFTLPKVQGERGHVRRVRKRILKIPMER